MRLKTLFMSMAASLALVGCTNEEYVPNGGNDPAGDGIGYVAVNIVQPKSVGSRANTGDYENGDDAENFANEGLFFILDENGNVQEIDGKSSQRVGLTGSGTTTTPAVERIYNAILVINGVKDNPTSKAKQIVCILNAPVGLENDVENLSDLQEKVEDYCTGHITNGKFVMSNSVYYDNDNNLIIGTLVTSDKIKESASLALANPVDIYVERVVAKVRATEKEGGMVNNGVKITVDGVEHTYKINIDGMALSNLSDKANLLKSLTGYNSTTWSWKDPANFRSFWEVMPGKKNGVEQVTVQKFSWDEIDKDSHYTPETTGKYCFQQYILPNTFSRGTGDVINTSINIAAHLTETVNGEEKTADLVWIRGGYTTDRGALNVIATAVQTNLTYYKKIKENSYKELEASDFEWTSEVGVGYSCYAKLKSSFGTDNIIYEFTTDPTTPTVVTDGVEKVNNYLKNRSNNLYARKYTDGKCYYYVEIEHVAATTGENATSSIKGIVRNHIYDLTLNSITGPGVPVFDPNDKVIPQDPGDENLYYLGARVNVLDWRIVSQGVDFSNGVTK